MLYISRTTINNFISLICLIKYEFEKVLISQRFNYFWRHVNAVFVYVFHSATCQPSVWRPLAVPRGPKTGAKTKSYCCGS